MSKHLFGLIVTPHGTAANNRGENERNITTLQKLLWNGEVHTTVSAEAIRWAIRYYWQRSGKPVNRVWLEEKNDHEWQDEHWLPWTDPTGKGKNKETFIDDDVLGFMLAEAAKAEGSEAEVGAARGKAKPKAKGRADKRRGALEVTRAISLTPFAGDITFNAKSGTKTSTSLYGTEVHATRFQYGFALTPESFREKSRALDVVDAVVSLSEVAGNQSRFLYGFTMRDERPALRPEVLQRIQAKDLSPTELVVGGSIALGQDGKALKGLGAVVFEGVKAAASEIKERMRRDLKLK